MSLWWLVVQVPQVQVGEETVEIPQLQFVEKIVVIPEVLTVQGGPVRQVAQGGIEEVGDQSASSRIIYATQVRLGTCLRILGPLLPGRFVRSHLTSRYESLD